MRRKLPSVRRPSRETHPRTAPDGQIADRPGVDPATAAALAAARESSRRAEISEVDRWREVLRAAGDAAPAEAWAMTCQAQRRAGEIEAAAATAATGLELWPDDPQLVLEDARTVHRLYRESTEDERHTWKARLLIAAGQLTTVRDAGNATKGARITEAEICTTLRRWPEATELWTAIAERYPDRRAGALLRTAEAQRRAGALQEARRTLDQAEDEMGEAPEYRAELARLTRYTGRQVAEGLASLSDLRVRLGHVDVVRSAIPEALRAVGHPPELVEQVGPIVESLGRLLDAYQGTVTSPALGPSAPSPAPGASPDPPAARPCILVSGFLYSGSGAVFDDLGRFENVNPAFGGREVGFLKKPGNLGMLLDAAASPPGPPLVARSVVASVFGFGQTGRPLLEYFEEEDEVSGLVERTTQLVADLRQLWERGISGAEPLSTVLATFLDGVLADLTSPHHIAMLNNAVIGHQLDRLQLFARARAAAVVRDPRDQYVSQRLESPNSMPCGAFIEMMTDRYDALTRLQADPDLGQRIEVVRFEDYVTDARVRERTRERLFREDDPGPVTGTGFRPEISRRNIGVHRDYPLQREIVAVEEALQARYREFRPAADRP